MHNDRETIDDPVSTRAAMNGTDAAERSAVGQRDDNGVPQYIRTRNRGNYLVPPRSLQSLLPANPSSESSQEGTDASS